MSPGQQPQGGPKGHHRHPRPRLPPDHTEDRRPAACRRCGHALHGDDPAPLVHPVLERPPIKPVVTEYRRPRLRCPHGRTTPCASLPPEAAATAGSRLPAAAALRTRRGVGLPLVGVPLSPAAVCSVESPVALAVAGAWPYAAAPPANIDAISGREEKQKGWRWTVVTAAVTVFLIRRSRGVKPLRELLGEGHDPVVTSDRFPT